jgi:uncharacterized membrane protein
MERLALAAPRLLASVTVLTSLASAQSFQGLGDLAGGTFQSIAYGVSADGTTVVGSGVSASGTEAVYWRNGVLTALADVAGGPVESVARGCNADGSVIVGSGRDGTAHRGVRWDGPSYAPTTLPQVPGFPGGSLAAGISANGATICGYNTDIQLNAFNQVTAYRIDNGVLTQLPYLLPGNINDSGAYFSPSADGSVIPGRIRTGFSNYQGVYWVGTTMHQPPALPGGPHYAQIFAASADGTAFVGTSCSNLAPLAGASEPCRWKNDVPLSLGLLPGGSPTGAALSSNHDGSVVVGHGTGPLGAVQAFVWDGAQGMRELATVLTVDHGLDLSGWTLTSARAMTPDGLTIVGYGTNPAGNQEGWIARLACTNAVSYCTPKTNALGCVPAISSSGVPSATAGAGFVVRSSQMRNAKPGLFLYTTAGPASAPFQGGTLCVASPIRRSVGLNSQGSPSGSDCTGVFSIDFNAFARGLLGGSPAAALSTPGTVVHSQFWGRDPGFPAPNNSQLSDGLRFTICD